MRRFPFLALLLTAVCLSSARADEKVKPDEFFSKQVLPILQANCFKCHGGEPKVESGLRLTSRAGVLKGGELGPAVDPKAIDDSSLLAAINYDGLEMPPKGKLPQAQIEVLTKWVKADLPWSGKEDYGVESHEEVDSRGDGSDYWAYQPIKRPDVPRVKHANWVRSPIDAFLLAKLEAAGLEPAGAADKVALIRRATYDLTGLPPRPEDVQAFVEDDSPKAFEKVIDRLLESPQYGERWGRHWLDLVRYAETHGYERDSPKPEAWRYRDYVIQSLNQDKPYDQFVIEQLAGDELPEVTIETLTATGFYRLGIWDDEPADRELARYDGLDDIAKTASEVVLGISMGCCRCHSHKVDPIEHDEYYSFLSYFHNITHPNRENLRRWATDEDHRKHGEQLAEKQRREEEMAQQVKAIETEFRGKLREQGIRLGGKSDDMGVVMADSRQQAQAWEYTHEKPSNDWVETDYSTTSWDKGPGGFGTNGTPGAVVRTVWNKPEIWMRKWFELKQAPKSLSLELHHDEDVEVFFNGVQVHSAKGYINKYQRVRLNKKAVAALKPGRNVIAVHCRQTGGGQYIDVGIVTGGPALDLATALKEHGPKLIGAERVKRLEQLRKELQQSKKRKLPPAGTPIMAVTESGNAPVRVLLRGNPHVPGDEVQPTVPKMLRTAAPRIPDPRPNGSSGRRLALAKWMFQDDNPLTARVLANRLWQHHFGSGIVPTPNDFGKLGELPTHPELLDYLASQIRDGSWRLKPIHKQIMLSAAYQMSTQANEQALEKDPSNRLYWRFNMRRLSSEEIRDAILAATGELNLKQGGPSIYVPIPAAVLQGQSRPGAGWGKSPPEEASRRSVYIHLKRSLLVPVMEMHDQADTDSSCPVRYVTTVPTQSLGMINGEFMQKKAAKLAERLQREAKDDRAEQVRLAIRLTTGRQPTDAEVEQDLVFLGELQTKENLSPEKALAMYSLVILNTNEFIYLD